MLNFCVFLFVLVLAGCTSLDVASRTITLYTATGTVIAEYQNVGSTYRGASGITFKTADGQWVSFHGTYWIR